MTTVPLNNKQKQIAAGFLTAILFPLLKLLISHLQRYHNVDISAFWV